MRKVEYDLLTWKSPPSSIKLFNSEGKRATTQPPRLFDLPVPLGSTITVSVQAKQSNVMSQFGIKSHVHFGRIAPDGRLLWLYDLLLPYGTFDWSEWTAEFKIPEDTITMVGTVKGGPGTPEAPGITWFDDLKIYQDDVLIYENDFSDWTPIIGATAGAIIGGIAGEIYKPIGPIFSPLLGALGGAALGAAVSQPATISTVTIPKIGVTPEQTYISTPPRAIAVN